ncbi:MAG: class I SAM-dependent methyltransferase [archaeon]|jgi:SAM-dependent methyltransferase
MVVKKISPIERARLTRVAEENSKRRFPGKGLYGAITEDWKVRKRLAICHREARQLDSTLGWNGSFNLSLRDSQMFFGVDLFHEIKKVSAKNGGGLNVLEVGGGTGRLANDLYEKIGGKINLSVTGLKRSPVWKTWKNSGKIRWRVMEASKISKYFAPESLDFVCSTLGVEHAYDQKKAISGISKVLKKGGRFLFNTQERNPSLKVPDGFREIKPPERAFTPSPYCLWVSIYYWEKI